MEKRKEGNEGKHRKDGTAVRRVKTRYNKRWGRRRRNKGEEDRGRGKRGGRGGKLEGKSKTTGEELREKGKRGEEEEHMKEIKEGKEGMRVEVERMLKKLGGEVDVEEIRRVEGERREKYGGSKVKE